MNRYHPRPPSLLDWPRAVAYYLYVALATVVLGLWGLPQVLVKPARAHRVATLWIGQMMGAARVILGVRIEVRGTPPTEDCLIAAKHQSFLDILAISQAVPQRAFVMKREIMRVPIMGWFAKQVGSIPIDRTRGSDAMKQIADEVEIARARPEGLGQLIFYPEGTRTRPGEKRRYKAGVASIQAATGLTIYPVAVNCGMFWSKRGIPIRGGVSVLDFLTPIPATGRPVEEVMAELETRVEAASDALIAEAGGLK